MGLHYIRLYKILYEDTIGSCYSSNGNQIIDTVNLTFNVPLSTNEIEHIAPIDVFPNPATDLISYETTVPVDKIEIINSSGIGLKELNPSKIPIDISGLPKGIYVIKFETDGQAEIVKIIKH